MGSFLVKGLSLSYKGKAVLENFSCEFPEKGACAIMGESGSGKTTLLHALMGLVRPTGGEICGFDNVKKSILFQEDRLLPWRTAKQNVALVSDGLEAMKWLCAFELGEYADKFPGEMSGGQRRRIALARCAAYGGDILLLDEPFNGLDEDLKRRVAEKLAKSFEMIVFSTHDEAEAGMFRANIIEI